MTDCSIKTPGFCGNCGKKLYGRQRRWCSRICARDFTANHRWTQARAAAKKRVTYYKCERCDKVCKKVEVNHIVPCLGKHGVWGCHHHADNLECLCIPCHRATTKEQREAGLL